MQLNHLDLCVGDVDASARFFAEHFGFRRIHRTPNGRLAVLHGTDGFVLVLSRLHDEAPAYPEGFHIGFLVDGARAVHAMQQRLQAAGVDTGRGVLETRRGTLLYFHGPDGLLIEVGHHGNGKATAPAV
ncbi:hypothetical protein ASG87_16130 [Frateuria sp. Soil773]|uniref:VOC family protein n=1 Tax=Frateuria sp. Soil773 TaxID=1736407 RepID=UPI0006FE0C30|nr:VOC family protein [Frateuria sp. Soil773]KRE96522.1 hypothetical protein ASG87_16130 [Frateuria sp. Soil773]